MDPSGSRVEETRCQAFQKLLPLAPVRAWALPEPSRVHRRSRRPSSVTPCALESSVPVPSPYVVRGVSVGLSGAAAGSYVPRAYACVRACRRARSVRGGGVWAHNLLGVTGYRSRRRLGGERNEGKIKGKEAVRSIYSRGGKKARRVESTTGRKHKTRCEPLRAKPPRN